LETKLIEAEQVEGKYVQEIVPAEAEGVGRECSAIEPRLETDCGELGSVGEAQNVTAQVHANVSLEKDAC